MTTIRRAMAEAASQSSFIVVDFMHAPAMATTTAGEWRTCVPCVPVFLGIDGRVMRPLNA
jgi:hypothetical protein